MDSLKEAIRRCGLSLTFDNITPGDGNCLPHALVQQCRLPAVRAWLEQNNPDTNTRTHSGLRRAVCNFTLQSWLPVLLQYCSTAMLSELSSLTIIGRSTGRP